MYIISLIYLIIDIDNDNLIPQIMPYRISPHPSTPCGPEVFVCLALAWAECSECIMKIIRQKIPEITESGPAQPSTIWMGGGETVGPQVSRPEQLVLKLLSALAGSELQPAAMRGKYSEVWRGEEGEGGGGNNRNEFNYVIKHLIYPSLRDRFDP